MITGDRLDATVSWQDGQSLAPLAGRQVQFCFSLTNADLYSYRVR